MRTSFLCQPQKYSFTEPFCIQGMWEIPGLFSAPGNLTFSKQKGLNLEVIQYDKTHILNLKNFRESTRSMPTITGKSINSTKITLIDCHLHSAKIVGYNDCSISQLTANEIIIGDWVTDLQDQIFQQCTVSYKHFDKFLPRNSPIANDIRNFDSGLPSSELIHETRLSHDGT